MKRADLTGTNLCASHLACASHVRLSIYGISVSSVFVFLGRQLQAPEFHIIKKWENLNENDGTYQITHDIREKIAQQVGLASFKCFPCFPLGFDWGLHLLMAALAETKECRCRRSSRQANSTSCSASLRDTSSSMNNIEQ